MQKYANLLDLEKCCQTHILNYILAKFRFGTAENEPAKNLQSFAKLFANFVNFANPDPLTLILSRPEAGPRREVGDVVAIFVNLDAASERQLARQLATLISTIRRKPYRFFFLSQISGQIRRQCHFEFFIIVYNFILSRCVKQ